tara:strand:+ start:1996 stop:2730 length:735 start_codon:yes stop_codon:yes gene_type:complete
MIEVKNISKIFGKKQVLKNISLTVPNNKIVSIIGKSGVGKSILLKSIIGLIKPDSGTIYIDNKLINSMHYKQLQILRSNIGMVFQFGALFDSLNVSENISLALRKLTKLNELDIKYRVNEALFSVGMEGSDDLMPSELSGGMKKRVGIARAIAIKPSYLFYDEPTTGLDPIMTDSINRLILKIQQESDITSLIVTHEMRTVYDISERVVMLNNGEVVFEGSPEGIRKSENTVVQQFIKGDSTLV